MWNVKCGIMKYEVFDEVNAECGIMNVECRMWNAECGMMNLEILKS